MKTADLFNRQLDDNEKTAVATRANGDKVQEERLTKAACLAGRCWAEFKPGSDEYNKNYVSPLEASQLGLELEWVNQQKQDGLFGYTPGQKIGDAVKSDPVGLAEDATKLVLGGITAKTGVTICATTGIGCVAGAGMISIGLSDIVEGGHSLYNRYNGANTLSVNPLRWSFTQLDPTWGDTNRASNLFNLQLHQREYDDAKIVDKELGISEQEAEGRIVAELLKNSDKQTADASGGKHDYDVRKIAGCQVQKQWREKQ